jgi:hypothetical protein
MASLVRAGKANGALANMRKNLKKEGDRIRPLRIRGLTRAVSKIYGSAKVKRHLHESEFGPYNTYINMYRWLNVIKKVPKRNERLTNRLTENNISEIQKNILRKMKKNDMYPNKKNGKINFSTKNGKTVLRIISPLNINNYPGEPYAKIYIQKKQTPKKSARYRIAPLHQNFSDDKKNQYMSFVPVSGFHRKNSDYFRGFSNSRKVGLVNVVYK